MEENNRKKANLALAVIIILSILIIVLIICLIFIIITYNNNKNGNTIYNNINNNVNSTTNSTVIPSGDENTDYIYNKDIQSITIKYFIGYNYETGESLLRIYEPGEFDLPMQTIELKSNELEEVSRLVKTLKKIKPTNDESYSHLVHDHIFDYFKLEINNDFAIYLGSEYGSLNDQKTYFSIPKELEDKIIAITTEYNKSTILKKINTTKATIISNNKRVDITNPEEIQELSDMYYYEIKTNDDECEKSTVEYVLYLDDGRKINIFLASCLSCMVNQDNTHTCIYQGLALSSYVKELFDKYSL